MSHHRLTQRHARNLQPGNQFVFGFGIILCHLGDNGRYIEIYATDDELKTKLQISVYDNEYELGFDICNGPQWINERF